MDFRVAHFGYTANYGGVEAYIRNMNSAVDLPIDLVVTTKSPIPFEEEFTKKGGRIFRITPRGKSYFRHYFDLIRLFKENKDIGAVYVHLNSCSSLAPLKVARLFGKRCIAHSHTSQKWNGKITNLLHNINQLFLPLITDYRRACSVNAGLYMFRNQSFKVVKNAIDVDKFAFSSEKRETLRYYFGIEDKFVIGHIGLFSQIKNQSFLVDVFHSLLSKAPNSVLMLVGNGAEKENVKNKVKQLNLADNVIFTGSRSDVDKLLCCMDAFVLPSRLEGLPLTLVEAQTCDLPCIVSDAVTDEAIICKNNYTKLSLEAPIEDWVNEILGHNNRDRKDRRDDAARAGFSIAEAGREYENFCEDMRNHLSGERHV